MASIQPRRGGLRWRSSRNGGLGTPPIIRRPVASAYGTALYTGDVVKVVSDGTVAVCGATDHPFAVVVGVERYLGADSLVRSGSYLPASTTYTGTTSTDNPLASVLLLIPLLDQLFEADMDTAVATYTAAQDLVGNCFNVIATAAGSAVNGQSGYTMNEGSAATSNCQFILKEVPTYGLGQNTMNDPTVAYWKGVFEVNMAGTYAYLELI